MKKLASKVYNSDSTLLFTLHLPESMYSIDLVFYMSMLKSTMSNSFPEKIQLASIPVITDRESKYEISQIIDSKINHQQVCKLLYKVI